MNTVYSFKGLLLYESYPSFIVRKPYFMPLRRAFHINKRLFEIKIVPANLKRPQRYINTQPQISTTVV